jgi:hypothetical protein
MAAALLPDPLWNLVEPFLPIPPDDHKVGGRVSLIAGASLALSSFFVVASPSRYSPRSSGADLG